MLLKLWMFAGFIFGSYVGKGWLRAEKVSHICSFTKLSHVLVSVCGVVCRVVNVRAPSRFCERLNRRISIRFFFRNGSGGKVCFGGGLRKCNDAEHLRTLRWRLPWFAGSGVLRLFIVQVSLSCFTFFCSFCQIISRQTKARYVDCTMLDKTTMIYLS